MSDERSTWPSVCIQPRTEGESTPGCHLISLPGCSAPAWELPAKGADTKKSDKT